MTAPGEKAAHESWLRCEEWATFPGLVHGFSRRLSDRDAALSALGAEGMAVHTFKQVHGVATTIVTHHPLPPEKPEADGAITTTPGVLLGIATADCVPVLIVAPARRLAAAVHAGWRGTLHGIAPKTVQQVIDSWEVLATDIWVALGPSIGGCCYEVGSEVGEPIRQQWRITDTAVWRPVGAKGFLDLRAVNTLQLTQIGVPLAQIRQVGPCTFCDSTFASYRREGMRASRQLSVIGWRES